MEKFAQHGPGYGIFSKSSYKETHIFYIAIIDAGKFVLHFRRLGYFRKVSFRFESLQFAADFIIAWKSVVATALNVKSCQIKSAGSRVFEQEVADFIHKKHVDFLAYLRGKAPKNRLKAGSNEFLWREESLSQLQMTCLNLVSLLVKTQNKRTQHTVPKPISGSREYVFDTCVDRTVIAWRIGFNGIGSQQYGQEFIIGDRLHLSADYPSCPLVDFLAGQTGVVHGNFLDEPVVLTHKKRVHSSQTNMFVGPHISRDE